MIAPERHSISIGAYNTWSDWRLIPSAVPVVNAPSIKTNYVDIPGFSKRLDFTDALQGSVPYGSRTGSWEFYVLNGDETLHQSIIRAIHGVSNTIVVDGVTYHGRITVGDWVQHMAPDGDYCECTLDYDLDP